MAQAAVEAQTGGFAVTLNRNLAASPHEFALMLRNHTPHADKLSMLIDSCQKGLSTLVRLLLADGLSPNTCRGEHCLLRIAAVVGRTEVVRILLEAGADANHQDACGNTPLANAIGSNQEECVRELIPHTNLRIFGVDGGNVLHCSIIANRMECFKLLLPHFADDIDGGYHAMVKALLATGASRTARDSNSFSCLHCAAQQGHLACVTLLIGRPDSRKMSVAEIDARGSSGCTPLALAARFGHRYCCAALLAAGADPAAAADGGITPLDAAKHFQPGNQELIELLECRGGGPAPLLCAGCGASDKRLRACSACQSAAFCSAACLAQFWPVHKAECRRIQAEKEELARSRVIVS